jgi:hypothetical protein
MSRHSASMPQKRFFANLNAHYSIFFFAQTFHLFCRPKIVTASLLSWRLLGGQNLPTFSMRTFPMCISHLFATSFVHLSGFEPKIKPL